MRILAVVAASVGDARLAGLRKAARERALEAVAVRLALGAASLSLGGGVGKRLGSGLHCGDSVIGDRRHRDDHREHDGQKCFVQHLGQISASEREVAGARGGEASRVVITSSGSRAVRWKGYVHCPRRAHACCRVPARMGPEEKVSCVPRERGGSEARRKRCSQRSDAH